VEKFIRTAKRLSGYLKYSIPTVSELANIADAKRFF